MIKGVLNLFKKIFPSKDINIIDPQISNLERNRADLSILKAVYNELNNKINEMHIDYDIADKEYKEKLESFSKGGWDERSIEHITRRFENYENEHLAELKETLEAQDFVKKSFEKAMGDYIKLSSNDKDKSVYAAVVLRNNEGKLLLLLRNSKDEFCPSTWCLPGGSVEMSEEPIEAAKRELKEEIHVDTDNLLFLKKVTTSDAVIYYFWGDYNDFSNEIVLNDEHTNYMWASREEWEQLSLILDLKCHLCKIEDEPDSYFVNTSGNFRYHEYLPTSLGRTRDSMPQIDSENLDHLLIHFSATSANSSVVKKRMPISKLKMAQGEVNHDKILNIISGYNFDEAKFIISKDGYIIDGHHRFAAILELEPEKEVIVYQVDLPASELLRRTNLMKISRKENVNGDTLKAFELDLLKGQHDTGGLMKKQVWVTRNGKGFYQTVYVAVDDEEKKNEKDHTISSVLGMDIQNYSDKAVIVRGNTYVNVDKLKEVKKELGVGNYNATLKGWIFPKSVVDKVLGILWSFVKTEPGEDSEKKDFADALLNQKNEIEPGTDVKVSEEIQGTIESAQSTNLGTTYSVKLEDGTVLPVDGKVISVEPIKDDAKIAEVINNVTPETRVNAARKLFGIKAIEDIHNYTFIDYAKMHGLSEEEIIKFINKKLNPQPTSEPKEKLSSGGGISSGAKVGDKKFSSAFLLNMLWNKHMNAVKKAIESGAMVSAEVLKNYPDLIGISTPLKEEKNIESTEQKVDEVKNNSNSTESNEKLKDLEHKKDGLDKKYEELAKEERSFTERMGKEVDYSKKEDLRKERSYVTEKIRKVKTEIKNIREEIKRVKYNIGEKEISFTNGEKMKASDYTTLSQMDVRLFDVETILNEERPPYIPDINEDEFKRTGVMDAIEIGSEVYALATNRFQFNHSFMVTKRDISNEEHGIVLVSLDQLVSIENYYKTKLKADNIKEAEERTARSKQHWDALGEKSKRFYMGYQNVPAKVKKMFTKEQWDKMPLEEQEKHYQGFKKYGPERLKEIDDSKMHVSFDEMYRALVDPNAKALGKGYASAEGSRAWDNMRKKLGWKKNDMQIEREFEGSYKKAFETSFGDTNTNDAILNEMGVKVKRQDGSNIRPMEIDQIKNALSIVYKTFGNLSGKAKDFNLKISHSGDKLMFASKAAGMYIPSFKTIGVSAKFGENRMAFTMAHEFAHWIDNMIGNSKNRRYASDDYSSTAFKIADTLRDNTNVGSESKYLNSTKECFARALEQYFAVENFGENAQSFNNTHYFASPEYVSENTYSKKLKPLIEEFLKEHKETLKSMIDLDISKGLDYKKRLADLKERRGENLSIENVKDVTGFYFEDYTVEEKEDFFEIKIKDKDFSESNMDDLRYKILNLFKDDVAEVYSENLTHLLVYKKKEKSWNLEELEENFKILKSAFDQGMIDEDTFLKALNKTNLMKKVITDKNGKKVTKWVRGGQEESKPKEGSSEEEEKKDHSPKELSNFARQASDSKLQEVASEAHDESMRVAAKKELARREKEESFSQEDKKGAEKKEVKKENKGEEKKDNTSKETPKEKGGKIEYGDFRGKELNYDDVETGKPIVFTYGKNLERSPKMGKMFAQDIEPHGRYMISTSGKYPVPGWEYGEERFKNPLVVEYKSTGHGGWKTDLMNQFNKKGKALSKELVKRGYDAIITRDKEYGSVNEIISLKSFIEGLEEE